MEIHINPVMPSPNLKKAVMIRAGLMSRAWLFETDLPVPLWRSLQVCSGQGEEEGEIHHSYLCQSGNGKSLAPMNNARQQS